MCQPTSRDLSNTRTRESFILHYKYPFLHFSSLFFNIVIRTSTLKIYSFKLLEKLISSKTMASKTKTNKAIREPLPLANMLPCANVVGNQEYVMESPNYEEQLCIYKSQVIIPYSISRNIHALLNFKIPTMIFYVLDSNHVHILTQIKLNRGKPKFLKHSD